MDLTLWIQEGEFDGTFEYIQNKIAEYLDGRKNLTITLVQKDALELREEFQTASAAGSAPQLLWATAMQADVFSAGNLIRPVDDLFNASDFVESIGRRGKTWGIPLFSSKHLMLLYNKSLVSRAPETFEELIEKARELTDGETFGLVYNTTEPFWIMPFLGGYGGSVFAADGVTPTLNTPEMVNTLNFITRLKFEYQITPLEADYGAMNSLFKEGNAAFIIDGDWSLSEYLEILGDDLAVAPMPSLPGGGIPRPYTEGTYFLVAEAVSEAEVAAIKELVAYFTSDELLLDASAAFNRLPASLSALASDQITSNPILAGSAAQLATGTPQPANAEMQIIWREIKPEQNAVLAGVKTAEEAAAAMQSGAENAIADMQ